MYFLIPASGYSRLMTSLASRGVMSAYIALMKPRIIELLLITTVPAMVLAAGGWPGTWLVLATLVGGTLSAGGANALNNYHDRDIDDLMGRTSHRPLPTSRVTPGNACVFGWTLGTLGFFWLWMTTNLLAAAISLAALIYYVYVYTVGLKRLTLQNIVIGGAAGAAPALVGWAAVTGSLDVSAWVLFAIVFAWTPPHFWALALRYREDYERAGVPMLPVVRGAGPTTVRISTYIGVTVLFSLALVPSAQMGWIYLVAAVGLGVWFMIESFVLHLRPDRAMRLFNVSNLYLALLFAAAMVDHLV